MHERKQSRLTLSWRVGVPHYETDEAFEALMEQVRANADWLDEVAFFDRALSLPEIFAINSKATGIELKITLSTQPYLIADSKPSGTPAQRQQPRRGLGGLQH